MTETPYERGRRAARGNPADFDDDKTKPAHPEFVRGLLDQLDEDNPQIAHTVRRLAKQQPDVPHTH